MVECSGKFGLGMVYIVGFCWGLECDYEYFFEMDVDFSYNFQDLVWFYKVCVEQGGDMLVGFWYVKGGKLENWFWDCILFSYGVFFYVCVIIFMLVKDFMVGFVCYICWVLEVIDFDKICFVGYVF